MANKGIETAYLASNLRALREARGLSRRLLADKAGTAITTITQIELGIRGIGLGLAGRLAAALGVPVDAFLSPLPPGSPYLDGDGHLKTAP